MMLKLEFFPRGLSKIVEEILLDVQVALNNRPLSYADDDVQLPLLTPNSLMFAQPNKLPELQPHHKRARYLK